MVCWKLQQGNSILWILSQYIFMLTLLLTRYDDHSWEYKYQYERDKVMKIVECSFIYHCHSRPHCQMTTCVHVFVCMFLCVFLRVCDCTEVMCKVLLSLHTIMGGLLYEHCWWPAQTLFTYRGSNSNPTWYEFGLQSSRPFLSWENFPQLKGSHIARRSGELVGAAHGQ